MPDRYSYPNSLVLINKLGITDYDRWKAVETAAIHQRMVELTEHPIPGRFELAHLQAIHRHLTADLYVWGGDIRDTDTHPGGTGIAHCRPPFIVPEAERVFGELAAREHLRDLDADAFSDGLAWVWGETTAIHPFRDVNTRSQHIMFNQLASDAGWGIDWSQIPGDVFAHARTLAIVEDHTGIDALIRPNCPASSCWQDFFSFEGGGGGVGQAHVHLYRPVPGDRLVRAFGVVLGPVVLGALDQRQRVGDLVEEQPLVLQCPEPAFA